MDAREPSLLSFGEKVAWLRLLRSENVGPVTFRYLLGRFGSAEAAIAALPDLAKRSGRGRRLKVAPSDGAERELERLDDLGASLLALSEPSYPAALAAVEDAPPLLYLSGDPRCLKPSAVGVVGARNASGNGRLLAERFASGLAKEELVVVSGLARGIDTAAHRAALAAGERSTIAVMAGGIDVVYPPENAGLAQEIAERALLVSEMPLGTEPQARHFPRRNRLIAGLSRAVLVVEAARRSGSLITARLAAEQGREVLAVPGSPLDPRAEGCNHLIREGATLVQSLADILESLGALGRRQLAEPPRAAFQGSEIAGEVNEAELSSVVECLSPSPLAVDEVIRRCQLSAPLVQNVLMELELAGRLERQSGNRVALIA